MKTYKVIVLEGDGIGPEIIKETIKVLNCIANKYKFNIDYEYELIGAASIKETNEPIQDSVLDKCKNADAILLGAVGDLYYDANPNLKIRPEQGLLKLRKHLNLFSNIRPVKAYKQLYKLSPLKEKIISEVDFIVYRELIGGIYFGEKGRETKDSAYDICSYHKSQITKIAHQAFMEAMNRKNKLTLVDKANVLETSRLWRETVTQISKEYPQVELDCMFVDNMAMQIITNPKQFDVIITENMFGDIITDEASVITGSLGMLPSASIGETIAMFEPIHGSFPQAAGKNIANPMATILSGALMLRYFKEEDAAKEIEYCIEKALDLNYVTKDINADNFLGTNQIADCLINLINSIKN